MTTRFTSTLCTRSPSQDNKSGAAPKLSSSETSAETRVGEFLRAFPHAWLAEQTLGRIDRSLAKLFEREGRKEDAVASAQEGADLFDRNSIALLSGWYRTGSGPTERDVAKADAYDSLLAGRQWGRRRVVVQARRLWLEDTNTYPTTLYLEDPRSPDDNPVERTLWQLLTLEGVELPADVAAGFDKTFRLAKTSNRSFVDLLAGAPRRQHSGGRRARPVDRR